MTILSSARKDRRRLIAITAILLIIAGGLGVGRRAWHRFRLAAADCAPPPPGMVLVPAGPAIVGSNDEAAEADERGLHQAWLPAFYIDTHEVTNREYRRVKPDHNFPDGCHSLCERRRKTTANQRRVGKSSPQRRRPTLPLGRRVRLQPCQRAPPR